MEYLYTRVIQSVEYMQVHVLQEERELKLYIYLHKLMTSCNTFYLIHF
jgi:hypothetical protein